MKTYATVLCVVAVWCRPVGGCMSGPDSPRRVVTSVTPWTTERTAATHRAATMANTVAAPPPEVETEPQPSEAPTTTTTSPAVHDDYFSFLGFPSHNLLKFQPVGLSWPEAKAVCEREGAKVAAFDSPNKMAALIGLFFEQRYEVVADIPNGVYVGVAEGDVGKNAISYGSTSSNASLLYWCRRLSGLGCASMVLGFCGKEMGSLDCSQSLNIMLKECERNLGDTACNLKLPFVCELNIG